MSLISKSPVCDIGRGNCPTFPNLPLDILIEISKYLSIHDHTNLGQTCQQLQCVFRPLSWFSCISTPSTFKKILDKSPQLPDTLSNSREINAKMLFKPERFSWFCHKNVRVLKLFIEHFLFLAACIIEKYSFLDEMVLVDWSQKDVTLIIKIGSENNDNNNNTNKKTVGFSSTSPSSNARQMDKTLQAFFDYRQVTRYNLLISSYSEYITHLTLEEYSDYSIPPLPKLEYVSLDVFPLTKFSEIIQTLVAGSPNLKHIKTRHKMFFFENLFYVSKTLLVLKELPLTIETCKATLKLYHFTEDDFDDSLCLDPEIANATSPERQMNFQIIFIFQITELKVPRALSRRFHISTFFKYFWLPKVTSIRGSTIWFLGHGIDPTISGFKPADITTMSLHLSTDGNLKRECISLIPPLINLRKLKLCCSFTAEYVSPLFFNFVWDLQTICDHIFSSKHCDIDFEDYSFLTVEDITRIINENPRPEPRYKTYNLTPDYPPKINPNLYLDLLQNPLENKNFEMDYLVGGEGGDWFIDDSYFLECIFQSIEKHSSLEYLQVQFQLQNSLMLPSPRLCHLLKTSKTLKQVLYRGKGLFHEYYFNRSVQPVFCCNQNSGISHNEDDYGSSSSGGGKAGDSITNVSSLKITNEPMPNEYCIAQEILFDIEGRRKAYESQLVTNRCNNLPGCAYVLAWTWSNNDWIFYLPSVVDKLNFKSWI